MALSWLREMLGNWGRDERNKINQNWEDIETKYSGVLKTSNDAAETAQKATTTANEAKTIAEGIDGKATQALDTANQADKKSDSAVNIATQKGDEAIDIANQANDTSNYVQSQLDNVIAEGDSSAEVVQARAEFVTLRERLDAEKEQVTSQLAQSQQQVAQLTNDKVDKIEGKRLSTNDYTNTDKTLVGQIPQKANLSDVASIAIGTPLFATNTIGMTDTTRLYVNTTDGYIYMYNGSAWASTGKLYQATGVEDDSIEAKHIAGLANGNVYDKATHYIDNAYISTNGNIITSDATGWGYAKVPVKALTNFYLYLQSGDYNSNSRGNVAFYNQDALVTSVNYNTLSKVVKDGTTYVAVNVPVNVTHLALTVKTPSIDDSNYVIVTDLLDDSISELFGRKLVDEKTLQLIESIKTEGGNIYEKGEHYTSDYLVSTNGTIQAAAGWGYAKVPVEGGSSYALHFPTAPYTTGNGGVGFYNEATLVSFGAYADYEVKQANDGKRYITLQIPVGVNYVAYNVKNPNEYTGYDDSETAKLYATAELNTVWESPKLVEINGASTGLKEILALTPEPVKPYRGVKWVVVGDSLTEENIRATLNYHDYIADELGFTVVNMGSSGTGYKRQEENNRAFYQRILNVPLDAEVVTIFGSGNDFGAGYELGTPTDTGTTTICGCINTTIDNFYTIHPVTPIGIITPCPWQAFPTNTDNFMAQYSEALITIAKSRGIPYLDLYRESGLRPWDSTVRNLLYKRDEGAGVHPDEDGQKILATHIREFLKRLI